jgi:glycosyltransferase involved in cell wall biosynthesis
MNKISLCLIAKNEAENIGSCIKSADEFVDEIIVVDTGSTDETINIAQTLGAKVYKEQWQNDFSYHRNTSLAKANSDWILLLDCDEELEQGSGQKLKNAIKNNSNFEAFFVQIINTLAKERQMTFSSIRIIKNRSLFHFTGKLHEQIADSIISKYGPNSIGYSKVKVIHHGYNNNIVNIEAKSNRNLEILKSYPEEKKDGFFYYNLGTEYLRLGEKLKALKTYKNALEMTNPEKTFGPILVKKTISTLMELKRYREAIVSLNYYQNIYTEFLDLWFLEGICHQICGSFTKAVSCFQKFKNTNAKHKYFYPTEFNEKKANNHLSKLNHYMIEKDYPEISICIMGRNNINILTKCIQSINEIANELIYFDIDSTDNSPALAYQMGAKVKKIDFNLNYAQIKNKVIKKASNKWILFINAYEIMPDNSRQQIPNLLKKSKYDGYIVKIASFFNKKITLDNCEVNGSCRLFRNKETYCFKNPYLGKIQPSIINNNDKIIDVDIQINSFTYLANPKQNNFKINIINKYEDMNYSKSKNYHLGLIAFRRNNFKKAINYFEKIYNKVDNMLNSKVIFYYTQALVYINQYQDAIDILNSATNTFTDYTDLFYLSAVAHFKIDNTEKASSLFKLCIRLGDAPWNEYIIIPGSGNYKSLCYRAIINIQKGNKQKAQRLLLEALEIPGSTQRSTEGIVMLFNKFNMNISLENFLKKHNMLNEKVLTLVANQYIKMGLYNKALHFITVASNHLKTQANDNVNNFLQSMDKMFYTLSEKIKNNFNDNSQITDIINSFNENGYINLIK